MPEYSVHVCRYCRHQVRWDTGTPTGYYCSNWRNEPHPAGMHGYCQGPHLPLKISVVSKSERVVYVEFSHLPSEFQPECVDYCLECGDKSGGPPEYHQVWKLSGDYKCVRCRAGAFRRDGTPSTQPDIVLIRRAIDKFRT